MDAGIVIALLSILGSIVLAVKQYKKEKAEANKFEAEAISNLVTVALSVSKQETDTLRIVLDQLKQDKQELVAEKDALELKIKALEQEISVLKVKLNRLDQQLTACINKLKGK